MGFRLAAAALLLVAAAAGPAAADYSNGPDESGVVDRAAMPFGASFIDGGLVALGGPPPEQGCLGEGFEDVDVLVVETPAGAIKGLIHDVQTFWIYEATSIGEVCEAALTTGIEPLAVGDATVRWNDNFANYEPGSRTNTFGGNANGTVHDADGNAWSFHGSVRLMIDRDGEFEVIKETIRLNQRGG